MISLVTAYYNRKALFKRTLASIGKYYASIDFEFIAVDDGSEEQERIEDLVIDYPFLKVIRIEKSEKWYHNPCIPFNKGIEAAAGSVIILQNPECYHFSDILPYVKKNLRRNDYLSFGCFSIDKKNTDDDNLFFDQENIASLITQNSYVVEYDGGLGWYNHSKYRPMAYHFCTAIHKDDLYELGGFDARYAFGYGYDDDDLIHRIRLKNMRVRFIDDHIVLHQNHYQGPVNKTASQQKYATEMALKNKMLFYNVTRLNANFCAGILKFESGAQFKERNLLQKLVLRGMQPLFKIYNRIVQKH